MLTQPSRREFCRLAAIGKWIPVAVALPLESEPEVLLSALRFKPPYLFLESARHHPVTGRYSLILGEPHLFLTAKGRDVRMIREDEVFKFDANPLQVFQECLDAQRALRPASFPPFVGGAAGYFGFDTYRFIESVPARLKDDLGLPDLSFLFFHQAVVVDHSLQKLWVIVLASPSENPHKEYDRTVGEIEALVRRLTSSPSEKKTVSDTEAAFQKSCRYQSPTLHWPVSDTLECTHTRESFETMVRKAQGFIAEGEIYQANLSQRFAAPLKGNPRDLYRRLKSINPSPFAAFGDFGDFQVISASPERFLRVQGRCVETRPIAGTRPKGRTSVETARLRQELILNEKERAEHIMLVDLERNDLGRVCRYGSVRVDERMILEEYSHVIHIVSNVRGTLKSQVRPVDLMAATFPGGTITGCPKVRCLEIIELLEPVRRQLYTGSLGYISFTGEMDLNLLIRTALVFDRKVYVQTGAGIVADSDPGKEYEETLFKAQALLEALQVTKDESFKPAETIGAS